VILYAYYDVIEFSLHETSSLGKVGISMMEESLVQIKATIVKALCMAKVLSLFQPSYNHQQSYGTLLNLFILKHLLHIYKSISY